jgi:hypothetical protein
MVLGLERTTVVKNVIMEFTPDSSKLVIYMKEINKLQIVDFSVQGDQDENGPTGEIDLINAFDQASDN